MTEPQGKHICCWERKENQHRCILCCQCGKRMDDITAREKSEAAIAIGLAVYARMVRLAHDGNQTIGEKRNYYVTLEQLEQAFVSIRDELRGSGGRQK